MTGVIQPKYGIYASQVVCPTFTVFFAVWNNVATSHFASPESLTILQKNLH